MTLAIEIGKTGLSYPSAILNYFNTPSVLVKGSIKTSDIKQYLTLKGLRVAIANSTSLPCQEVMLALADFDTFDCSNPNVLSVLTSVLDALMLDTLIPAFTGGDKANILAMADRLVSPAESLGITVSLESVHEALGGSSVYV